MARYYLRKLNTNPERPGMYIYLARGLYSAAGSRRPRIDHLAIFHSTDEHPVDYYLGRGWELVPIVDRSIPGLGNLARQYRNRVRQLAGASAMLAKVYADAGYSHLAITIEQDCQAVKRALALRYALAKRQIVKEHQDAKSRQ